MKTCIVIPTYNEAKAIAGVIKKIYGQNLEVLVIDDGSQDNTAQIAVDSGATVMKNPANLGKGACLISGFSYILSNNFDAVITMDGDGQHQPEDIPFFLRLAQYSDSGVFIGNRMHKVKNMPLVRLLTNKFMSWMISRITRQVIPDTQCGFRLIKKEVLNKVNLQTCRYETESEILIRASRLGFKIESVPIDTLYAKERSHINPFTDTLRFIRFISRELWTIKS